MLLFRELNSGREPHRDDPFSIHPAISTIVKNGTDIVISFVVKQY